jgi:flagellar biogenesis protein FliO
VGVGLVMALLFGAAWIAARQKKGLPLLRGALRLRTSNRRLQLVERLPLTSSHSLHLIQFDGRPYLVATHPQGASLAAASGSGDFATVFASSMSNTTAADGGQA